MKIKALRFKDTKEFVYIEEMGGEPQVFTGILPKAQPETATIESMKEIFEKEDYYEGLELDWDNLELAEFEVIEANTVGADIRNKLTPSYNLVALLELYFKDNVAHATEERANLARLIKTEMEKSKENIKYIAGLL